MKAAQALAGAAQKAQPAQGEAQEKPSFDSTAQSGASAGAGQQAEQAPATEGAAGAESSAQSPPQLVVDEFDVPQGDIPEGMLPLIYKFYPQGTGNGYIPCGNATIRNATELPDSEVAAEVNGRCRFPLSWTATSRRCSSCTRMPLKPMSWRKRTGATQAFLPAARTIPAI